MAKSNSPLSMNYQANVNKSLDLCWKNRLFIFSIILKTETLSLSRFAYTLDTNYDKYSI